MDRHGQIWTDMDRYGQIWTDMDSHRQKDRETDREAKKKCSESVKVRGACTGGESGSPVWCVAIKTGQTPSGNHATPTQSDLHARHHVQKSLVTSTTQPREHDEAQSPPYPPPLPEPSVPDQSRSQPHRMLKSFDSISCSNVRCVFPASRAFVVLSCKCLQNSFVVSIFSHGTCERWNRCQYLRYQPPLRI